MGEPDALILSVDTTSRFGSVAVARNGRVVASLGAESTGQQSSVLWKDIDQLLVRVGANVHDVDAFAVVTGPGAFTGLRIGLAAAMGLARATGKPLYGATSLELTARTVGPCERVWSVLNAYRNEVYAQPFAISSERVPHELGAPSVEVPAAFFDRISGESCVLVGSGVAVYAPAPSLGWTFAPAPAFLASELAELASLWLSEGRDPGIVTACYVRPSEAEINLKLAGTGSTRPA